MIKNRANELLIRFIKVSIICWFAINMVNFINFRFFEKLLAVKDFYVPVLGLIIPAIIVSLLITFYAKTLEELLSLKKGFYRFPFMDSLIKFNTKLSIYERLLFVLFLLVVVIVGTSLAQILSIFLYRIVGGLGGLICFFLLEMILAYFVYLIIISQKFIYFKMELI